jgi:chromate transporter
VGTKVDGLLGAVIATVGCVTPSIIIVLILARIYFKYRDLSLLKGILAGLRPATVALIASAGLSIIASSFFGTKLMHIVWQNTDIVAIIVFAAGLITMRIIKKLDPILVIAGAGALGLMLYALSGRL